MTTDKTLKRIMYVDDDPDLQEIVRLGLEKGGGFEVRICSSGHQAIEEIPGFHPDVLILDVVMPDISGPKTLEALRNMPDISQIPVIFMTSKIQPKQMELYKKLGALGVIKKPLNPMSLASHVKDIWEETMGLEGKQNESAAIPVF